ncbi:HAD-IA family hydrolase [Streptomyces cupreus]|uniref:HAD-IA family hydrolase n=1 Tax=Streptomyces cupreus TaxID=2759956 RepID=A0A7X1IZI1_9ACTN|nr:HAD-IA family hydrolase [Streptomyces cupreus]MBC2900814.1 HAD-IA family hydrolase [Streptomyces cupreus]
MTLTTVLRPSALAGHYAAVLLDLDGTLVDSRESVDRAWRVWCERYEVQLAEIEGLLHGRTASDLVRLIRPHWSERRVAEAARFQLLVQEEDPEPGTAVPGAGALLGALGNWAVVTACSRRLAAHRLRSAGLPVPPVLVCAEDVRRGKPHPESYELGAARLGVRAADCLVVEDAPSGVRAGRAAGCAVAAVPVTHAAGALGEATAVVESLAELAVVRSAA